MKIFQSIIYVKEYFKLSFYPEKHYTSTKYNKLLNLGKPYNFLLKGHFKGLFSFNVKFLWALGQILRHSEGAWALSHLYTRTFGQLGGTRAFEQLRQSSTWVLRVLGHLSTWTHRAFRHLGTRHSNHSRTGHLGTWGTLFSRLVYNYHLQQKFL